MVFIYFPLFKEFLLSLLLFETGSPYVVLAVSEHIMLTRLALNL